MPVGVRRDTKARICQTMTSAAMPISTATPAITKTVNWAIAQAYRVVGGSRRAALASIPARATQGTG